MNLLSSIFPLRDMALRVAQRLIMPGLAEGVPLGRDMGIMGICCPAAFVDRTLNELALPDQYGVALVGLRVPAADDRHTEELQVNPSPDTRLEAKHDLLLVGSHKQLSRFKAAIQQALPSSRRVADDACSLAHVHDIF